MYDYDELHCIYIINAIIKYIVRWWLIKHEQIHESASLTFTIFTNQLQIIQVCTGDSSLQLLLVFVMWFILEKTTRGFELKAVGFNQNASEYAGMNVNKNIILAMVISGVFAGLAGAMEALGTFENVSIKARLYQVLDLMESL